MMNTSTPTLNQRRSCPYCQRQPETTRKPGGSETTGCKPCHLAVNASNGDSITPWNKLVGGLAEKEVE